MKPQHPTMKKFAIEIKWALVFSAVTLVWIFTEKTAGLHGPLIAKQPLLSYLFAPIAIAMYVMALREKKHKGFSGRLTWKQGVVSGLYLSAFIAILSPIVQYISFTVISPEFLPNMIAYVTDKNLMTPAQAQVMYSLNTLYLQGAFGALSMGIVTAAGVSYFVRSKPPKQ